MWIRLSSIHIEVSWCFRQLNYRPLEYLWNFNLAAQPAGRREPERKVKQILLFVLTGLDLVVQVLGQDYMASRACKRSLTGSF